MAMRRSARVEQMAIGDPRAYDDVRAELVLRGPLAGQDQAVADGFLRKGHLIRIPGTIGHKDAGGVDGFACADERAPYHKFFRSVSFWADPRFVGALVNHTKHRCKQNVKLVHQDGRWYWQTTRDVPEEQVLWGNYGHSVPRDWA